MVLGRHAELLAAGAAQWQFARQYTICTPALYRVPAPMLLLCTTSNRCASSATGHADFCCLWPVTHMSWVSMTCDHVVCRPRNSGGVAGRGARGPHDACLPSPLGHPLRGWYSLGVPCWQGSAARLLLAQAATVEEANTCECRVSLAEAVLNARVRAAGPLPFEWRLLPLKYFDVSNNSLTGDLSFLPRSLLSSQF